MTTVPFLRSLLVVITTGLFAHPIEAATSYGYSANAGWIVFGAESPLPAKTGATFLSGYAYAANFGWIDFGDGTPVNGTTYSNTSAGDFGVNRAASGNLSGYAYSANIGWINFSWATAGDSNRPRVDAITGNASGFAYSANAGWIDLGAITTPGITTQPMSQSVIAGGSVTFTVLASGSPAPTFQWKKNGAIIAGATGSAYTVATSATGDVGGYTVEATGNGVVTSEPAVLAIVTTSKVIGSGSEVGTNILHPSGNIYDQILLQGSAATITADPGQVTRISYVDLNNDIVQVEFGGAGSLSLVLESPTGPAAPVNYNQPAVSYMKGHASVVIAGANETTNVSVFSVGRINAVNQALFRDGVPYDGFADIAFLSIQSVNGKFGGIRTANTSYFAANGSTGIHAPGVQFTGPVFFGDITAFDAATPLLMLGGAADVRITGGDLLQANARPVKVSGLTQLKSVAGSTSHGITLPARIIAGRLEQNGVDVTNQIVVYPVP